MTGDDDFAPTLAETVACIAGVLGLIAFVVLLVLLLTGG